MPALEPNDLPPLVIVDRRRTPDRRTVWRGGRRDSDWLNRPAGAWQQRFEARLSPWRAWLNRSGQQPPK